MAGRNRSTQVCVAGQAAEPIPMRNGSVRGLGQTLPGLWCVFYGRKKMSRGLRT